MTRTLVVLAALLLLVWGRTAVVAVDAAEFALVTRFGAPVEAVDGGADAGLRVKWPWPVDAVARVDRRVQCEDLPAVEALTRDAAAGTVDKTLAVDVSLTWRVPDAQAAERFSRTLGTPDQVRRVLSPRVAGRVAAAVSAVPLDQLLAVAADAARDARAERFRRAVLGAPGTADDLAAQALTEYGVEVVDLRVRRFRYPDAVRAGIADRIRSERARKAAEYESAGRLRAADISSRAEKDARTVEAQARADADRLTGEADAVADAVRAKAFSKDPAFYQFLQKLKGYQAMLADTRDVLLLSTRHPLFDLLLGPPKGGPK